MIRNYLLVCLSLVLVMASCTKEQGSDQEVQINTPERTSKENINAFVLSQLHEKNIFKWETMEDEMLWSAMSHGNDIASIGYQPAGFTNMEERIHEIDITKGEWRTVRQDIIDLVLSETQRYFPEENMTAEKLLMGKPIEEVLPNFSILIKHPAIVTALRERADVRYVEPMNYSFNEVADRSDSGCDISPASNIPSADYTTTSPSAKIPWNFHLLNIPTAWNTSQGDNIGVCLIDTGTSPNQSKLGSQFASGQSTNRYISRYGTYVSSWWWWASPDGPDDDCGHGTQMAGLIAGPRTSGGSTTGAAYKANLISYRGTGDVVVNSSNEKEGVSTAIVAAGNHRDRNIISMSNSEVFTRRTVGAG